MPSPQKKAVKESAPDSGSGVLNTDQLKIKSFDTSNEDGKKSFAQIELMIKKLNKKEDEMLSSIYQEQIV